MYTIEVLSLLQIGDSQGTAMLLCSLPMKNRKMLSPGIFDTFVVRSNLVHDVSDSDCYTQSGCTRGCVFVTFRC